MQGDAAGSTAKSGSALEGDLDQPLLADEARNDEGGQGGNEGQEGEANDHLADEAPPTPKSDEAPPEDAEEVVVEPEAFEVPMHEYLFNDEAKLWESDVAFHALSLCPINIMGFGRDRVVVTHERVIVARARAIPPNFSQRYVATAVRRTAVTSISLVRCVRFIKAATIWTLIWLVFTLYWASNRFLPGLKGTGSPPAWADSNWTIAGLIVAFLIVLFLWFANDWLVTISYRDRSLSSLSKGKLSARLASPTDVAELEEAIRCGYVGGGGWMDDEKTAKKEGGKGYTETRQLNPNIVADMSAKKKTGAQEKMTADDRMSVIIDADDSDDDESASGQGEEKAEGSSGNGKKARKKKADVGDAQVRALHKCLLPGERVIYRCKHRITLLCCLPLGNNTVTVTNKRILIKRARYPFFGLRNKWVSRYAFASIPIDQVRTFQHAFVRLFGIRRFVWATILMHVALVFFWFKLNDELCFPEQPGTEPHRYCAMWLPRLPELLLKLDSLIYLFVAAGFFGLMLLFQFTRGWGLVFYPGDATHMTEEELTVALSGPKQMNSVEHAVRMGERLQDPPLLARRADAFIMPSEQKIGVAACANGKIVVTDKRVLICRSHTENHGFLRRRVFFWFQDYRVGSVDVRDVVGVAHRWIPLHDKWFMWAMLWLGAWAFFIGTLFRNGACGGTKVTINCNDIPSLAMQIGGAVLVLYWMWAVLKHRTPGAAFAVDQLSRKSHNTEFLRCRIEVSTANVVQLWLRKAQIRSGQGGQGGGQGDGGAGTGDPATNETEKKPNARYTQLIVVAPHQLRIVSDELPYPGRRVLISQDSMSVRWKAVKLTRGGAVILECEDPVGTVKHGKLGDDLGAGYWDDAPPEPFSEQVERENIKLREKQRHHESDMADVNGKFEALRRAYNEQTMRLIACNEELERTRQDQDANVLSHRRERLLLQEALLAQRDDPEAEASPHAQLDISAPPTPDHEALRIESPPPGTPPMDDMASAPPPGIDGLSPGVAYPYEHRANPLRFAQGPVRAQPAEDIEVDTPPDSPQPVYQLQSYRSPYRHVGV